MGSGSSKDGKKVVKVSKKDLRYFLSELKDHEGGINSMCITPDGSMICTGGEDKIARIYDLSREDVQCVSVLKGHDSYINWVVCNNTHAFTAAADHCIRKWSLDTGMCAKTMKGHLAPVNRMILMENILFTTSYDRTSRCWDIDSGECIKVFNSHKRGVYPLLYVPIEGQDSHRNYADLENNNDLLVTGSADQTAKSWALDSGQPIITFRGHSGAVLCLAVDSSAKNLYTGSVDNTCRSWDLNTGKPLKTFEGHQASVIQLQVVNRLLFSASADHSVKCWVTEFGDCTRTYKGHTHSIVTMVIFNGLLITGSGDCSARAYDAKSGSTKRIFRGHSGTVNAVVFHKNRLYTASHDGSIRIWDASQIKEGDDVEGEGAEDKGSSTG